MASAFFPGRIRPIIAEGRIEWVPAAPLEDPLEGVAIRFDEAARRLAKGRGAIDLAIGECLHRLFMDDRHRKVGPGRQVDFAREALGIPARTMYAFLELARAVEGLKKLRAAVVRGDVSPRKARAVAPAIRGAPEREEWLVAVAARRTLSEIEGVIEGMGETAGRSAFEIETLRHAMVPKMQDLADLALEKAAAVGGPGRPRFVYEHSIAGEFLGSFGKWAPETDGKPRKTPAPRSCFPPGDRERRRLYGVYMDRYAGDLASEVGGVLDTYDQLVGLFVPSDDPEEMKRHVLRLLALRRRRDEPLGRLLEAISTLEFHRFVGFASFPDYARERLGISERGARQRRWLERKLEKRPALREALVTGRLTYSKTLVVAGSSTPSDVEERIREAEETTCQQIRRKQDEKEDRQNRAVGIRRFWGPEEVIETIAAAILAARAYAREMGPGEITPGEAWAAISTHYLDAWSDPKLVKRTSKLRKTVIARTKGVCATPGCGNPIDQVHHIIFRSRGGPHVEWNCTGVCVHCHSRIHGGWMRVNGRAGEKLVWRIRRGKSLWEVWETHGDDDVRRVREEVVPDEWV